MAEKEKQYIIMRIDYETEDGTATFREIGSNFSLNDVLYDRIYEMMKNAGSSIARNLRKGVELKVIIDD